MRLPCFAQAPASRQEDPRAGLLSSSSAEAAARFRRVRDLHPSRSRRLEQEAAQCPACLAHLDAGRRAGLCFLSPLHVLALPMRPAQQVPSLPQPMDGAPSLLPGLFAFGLLCLVTIAAVVVSNGNLAIALAPCLIALVLWDLWALPLRVSLLTLLLLSWTLEIAGDVFAGDKVKTPLRVVGTLLFAKLNVSIPVDALVFSGLDILLLNRKSTRLNS